MNRVLLTLLLVFSLLFPAACAPSKQAVDSPSPTAPEAVVPTPAPTPIPTPEPPPAPTVATLAVCGDVMTHMPVTNCAWNGTEGEYDYTPIMAAAKSIVSQADYAVANLETNLAGGPKYSGYPAFNAPDALAYNLKDIGFDLMLTSNNHCLDKGFSGLSRTLDVLDEAGLAHVGTSRTADEAQNNIVVADVGGISVAFLGYTYGTNGIPLPKSAPYAVNLFNTDYLTSLSSPDTRRLLEDLTRAEALGTDLVAVMIHWGVEYQTTQNSYQEQIADLLFENGADIVLGGHPHVLQPMAYRAIRDPDGGSRQGFVCYSLGNFISSQVAELTDVTAVLTLELTRDNVTGKAEVTGCTYAPMLMDRRTGNPDALELLDARAVPAGASEQLASRLASAARSCRDILGDFAVTP